MRTYFITANLWLAVAFLVFLGRHTERNDPTMYSFFGVGGWYEPREYGFLVAIPLAAAFACLALYVRSRPGAASQRDTRPA
jgi:hypothetical protein